MNLIKHIEKQAKFSVETFGPGKRTATVLAHIKKELIEIEDKPHDLSEWADLILLAIDGATRQGFTADEIAEALSQKLEQNMLRSWPDWRTVPNGETIEHIRT